MDCVSVGVNIDKFIFMNTHGVGNIPRWAVGAGRHTLNIPRGAEGISGVNSTVYVFSFRA